MAICASFVETVGGLKVPPAFPQRRRHARLCLPALLRVLSWVPWASVPHASRTGLRPFPQYCALLRLPSSFPVPTGVSSSVRGVACRMPGCWFCRPPSCRPLLPRRREALPSSRVTPVNTCPALRPRWCPVRSPWRAQDCCLPEAPYRRLWDRLPGLILLSTTIQFSEFNDPACVLAFPLLRTPPLSGRTSVRLRTGWLAFGPVGLEFASHPLGNIDMFQEVSPPFSHPEFTSARAAGWFGDCLMLNPKRTCGDRCRTGLRNPRQPKPRPQAPQPASIVPPDISR